MPPGLQRWLPRLGLVAAGLVPVLLLFWDCFVPGHTYFGHDIAIQQQPFAQLARESLARGEMPFWNPHLFGGTPLVAPGNAGVLTPLFLATTPLPLGAAFTAEAMLALLIAYAGAAALGWYRTRSAAAAATAGLIYMLSGPVLLRTYAGHPHLLQALAVVPWLFYSGEALLEHRGVRAAIPIAVCTAVLLVAHPHIALLSTVGFALMLGVRLAWRARTDGDWKPVRRPLAIAAAGGLCGALLAAPQLLPGLEFADQSMRQGGQHLQDALYGSVGFRHLTYLLFPFADGHPAEPLGPNLVAPAFGDKDITYWEVCGFTGVLGLGLAIIGCSSRRRRTYGWLALIALVTAFGYHGPLYRIAFYVIPKLSLFRVPGRLLFLFALGVAVAAAEGLALLRADGDEGDRARRWAPLVAAAVAVAALIASVNAAARFTPYGPPGAQVQGLDEFWVLACWGAVIAFAAAAVGSRFAREATRPLLAAVPWIVALELVVFASGFVYKRSLREDLLPDRIARVAAPLAKTGRFDVVREARPDWIRPNVPFLHGWRCAGGYDPAVTRRYMQLYNTTNNWTPNNVLVAAWRETTGRLTPLTNLRLVVSREQVQMPGLRKLATAADRYGVPVHLWAFDQGMPRAYVVHRTEVVDDSQDELATLEALRAPGFPLRDVAVVSGGPALNAPAVGGDHAAITTDDPRRVVVDATLGAPGLLVLLDAWYPGWSVTVDGAPAELVRANHAFRAVALPAGHHTAEFTYRCAPFTTGLWIALLGLAALGGLWWWGRAQPEALVPAPEEAPA